MLGKVQLYYSLVQHWRTEALGHGSALNGAIWTLVLGHWGTSYPTVASDDGARRGDSIALSMTQPVRGLSPRTGTACSLPVGLKARRPAVPRRRTSGGAGHGRSSDRTEIERRALPSAAFINIET